MKLLSNISKHQIHFSLIKIVKDFKENHFNKNQINKKLFNKIVI